MFEGERMHACEECAVLIMLSCLMLCAGNGVDVFTNVVDIFNATTGTWSVANLSQARVHLAATSLPNVGVAMFAGGIGTLCDDSLFFRLQGGLGCYEDVDRRGWGGACMRGKIDALVFHALRSHWSRFLQCC